MITPINASLVALPSGNSFSRPTTKVAAQSENTRENTSDTVTVSDEARFRLSGEARRFSDLIEVNGSDSFVAVKLSEAQIAEGQLYEQQIAAREQANSAYARAHPYQALGQVFANGKAVATVYEGGGYALSSALSGLSSNILDPQERLAEIARITGGNIVLGTTGTDSGVYGPGAPE